MFWAVILAFVLAIVGVSIIAGKVIAGRTRYVRDPEDTPVIPDPF